MSSPTPGGSPTGAPTARTRPTRTRSTTWWWTSGCSATSGPCTIACWARKGGTGRCSHPTESWSQSGCARLDAPRWRHLVPEMAKFGIVGAVNTVVDFGLANLLYLGAGWSAMGAKTTSVAVAATSSFFMNRHWTFRHRARTGLRREYTLFFLLNGVGLLIANACILVVEQGMGKTGPLWFNIAQLAGLALGM